MNNEIKEILDWLKDEDIYIEDYGYQYKRISLRETKLLLDYITNLQQELTIMIKDDERNQETIIRLTKENERLKNMLNNADNKNLWLIEEINDKQDIIDKAIEYYKYQLENLDFYEDTKARMLCAMGIALLQNGSE